MRPIHVNDAFTRNQQRRRWVQWSDPAADNVVGVPGGTASSARLSLLT
jgi:hypothetical protein